MISTLIALVLAPLLTAAATLTARRFGPRAGGVVSAFPAIVGPVLLVVEIQHGAAFAARAADGTMLGLVALAGFAVGYAWAAGAAQAGWQVSLVTGWAGAAAAAGLIELSGARAGPVSGPLVAAVSLGAAFVALPRAGAGGDGGGDSLAGGGADGDGAAPGGRLAIRMALAAALVVGLPVAAGAVGPVLGGMLAALPVLASVLAVFAHRDGGGGEAVSLLRGMLAGMGGFVAFCEIVALLVTTSGAAVAFGAATAAAVTAQAALRQSPTVGRRRQTVGD